MEKFCFVNKFCNKKEEQKQQNAEKKKPGRNRAFMMDGLVSTRKFLSLHNIKNKFSDNKNISKLFYTHFLIVCGKGLCVLRLLCCLFSDEPVMHSSLCRYFF
jgi:hypothetical protein